MSENLFLNTLRRTIQTEKKWPAKPDRSFRLDAIPPHGWLLPTLLDCEGLCWGRWPHWFNLMEAGKLIDEPIPQIRFDPQAAGLARKMHENSLNSVASYGGWQGWDSWRIFDYYLDWLLYAFGHPGQRDLPPEPQDGAFERLYQTFCLEAMLAWPADLFGDMLAENNHGRSCGFFPTPEHVVAMMVQMAMGDEDTRAKSVMDPCLGTGRMLLAASNYAYRLYGMDINATVIKAALVNGYCFAPWLVRPLPFLDRHEDSAAMSDAMSQPSGRADVDAYLANTEHDAETQYRFEPIKKRRKKDEPVVLQGELF